MGNFCPMTFPASKPRRNRLQQFVSARITFALILREMATRYGRSPGGYAWALLEPLGGIIILSVAFELLVRNPSLGHSFLLFFATAYLPLTMYLATSNMVQRSIIFSRPLLKYPVVSWIDAVMARFLLNALTTSLIAIILLYGILEYVGSRTIMEIPTMIRSGAHAWFLAFGVGTLNCVATGFFPIWANFWAVLTRPVFLLSGIFYIYEDLPQLAQDIIWFNPLIHITGLMRDGLYSNYRPQYISEAYVFGFALVTTALGLLLIRRYNKELLNR
jgi:capsular polysaccharide transport system permease protein